MPKKFCIKCRDIKDTSEFHRHSRSKDGLFCWCKQCKKDYNTENSDSIKTKKREHYIKNKESINQKSHEYYLNNKEKAREYNKNYREKNKEELAIKKREYYQTPSGVESKRRNSRKMSEKYPERKKARRALAYAIESGRMQRQPCEVCGKEKDIQGHHEDYTKLLEVNWLCIEHHAKIKVNI